MNSNELTKSINTWALTECKHIYDRMFEGVKEKTPVKTGHARDSWERTNEINVLGEMGVIRNNASYIGWLEFGTDDTLPHHMVGATILEIKRDYP